MSVLSTLGRVMLRDITPADYPRFCELRNHTLVEPMRVDVMESRDRNPVAGEVKRRIAACLDGRVVGVGGCGRWPTMAEGRVFLTVDVDPALCRQGIGSKILEDLESWSASQGARRIHSVGREDREAGRAFLARNGFAFHQHMVDSELDLAAFCPEPFSGTVSALRKEHIELRTYSELGDSPENRRRLHRLHNACDADSPGVEEWGLSPFEGFEGEVFESPRYWPDGIVVACRGDEWIGLSMVGPVTSEIYGTAMTGVMADWRGKGIGLAAKSVALAHAKARGGQVCRAQNDQRNLPMLNINRKLGFQPQFGWIFMRKDL